MMTPTELIYVFFEALIALVTILGNLLVILAFILDHDLQTTTNFFVLSLALVDMLVGAIGIPLFVYSFITTMPADFFACLVVNTWIMMLCTVSIFHLLAVSFDRYMAIVWFVQTSSGDKRMHARLLISAAWVFGSVIGLLPLLGWNMGPPSQARCDFVEIMDFSYLLFLYYSTIIAPTFFMLFFYASIYLTVSRHRTKTLLASPANQLRQKERKLKRQRKVIFSLLVVIVTFLICWYPLYTMNAITYYCPKCQIPTTMFYTAIVLSHLSSAVNPFIYAYTMPGFKDAFQCILFCQYGERTKLTRLRRRSSVALSTDNLLANLKHHSHN